jgi:hypothetical protein
MIELFIFFFSSFSSPLVELLCLFLNDGGVFYLFYLGYGHEKPNKNLVSMLIHGDLTFRV